VSRWLNEWRNDQRSETLDCLDKEDQSLWSMTKRMIRVPTPYPPLVTLEGFALSDSKISEALANSLETDFQPVADPSVPA
jgi:hypothetical protein